MPYIYVEELAEGQEEADVVAREDYDGLQTRFDETETRVDELVSRCEQAESDLKESRRKYAEAFMKRKPDTGTVPGDSKPEPFVKSYSELFA